ncbi:MAG: hypothetical protein CM15mP120_14820 [Pseudomonadota bacterium]|nr:MAG: hypothetical protein CM15mP120_14820 [Pseudomonadota bacterium]
MKAFAGVIANLDIGQISELQNNGDIQLTVAGESETFSPKKYRFNNRLEREQIPCRIVRSRLTWTAN